MLKNRQKGFTLIEMMVAVSIFSIIALIVSSVFITVAYSYQKARDLGRLADNINFAMDHMTYNLKISTDYECSGSGSDDEIKAELAIGTDRGSEIVYKVGSDDCLEFEKGPSSYCLTEVDSTIISNFSCHELRDPSAAANGLKINLQGQVISSFGDSYEFDLQTFVTERYAQ